MNYHWTTYSQKYTINLSYNFKEATHVYGKKKKRIFFITTLPFESRVDMHNHQTQFDKLAVLFGWWLKKTM